MSIRIYDSPCGTGYEYSFTHDIAALTSGGTVSFATLPVTPTICHLTVECPADGVHINAALVAGTLTSSAFNYTLSGLATSAEYVLHITLKW